MAESPLSLKNPIVRDLLLFAATFASGVAGLVLLCTIVAFMLSQAL